VKSGARNKGEAHFLAVDDELAPVRRPHYAVAPMAVGAKPADGADADGDDLKPRVGIRQLPLKDRDLVSGGRAA
jgi:hypothetical protein